MRSCSDNGGAMSCDNSSCLCALLVYWMLLCSTQCPFWWWIMPVWPWCVSYLGEKSCQLSSVLLLWDKLTVNRRRLANKLLPHAWLEFYTVTTEAAIGYVCIGLCFPHLSMGLDPMIPHLSPPRLVTIEEHQAGHLPAMLTAFFTACVFTANEQEFCW